MSSLALNTITRFAFGRVPARLSVKRARRGLHFRVRGRFVDKIRLVGSNFTQDLGQAPVGSWKLGKSEREAALSEEKTNMLTGQSSWIQSIKWLCVLANFFPCIILKPLVFILGGLNGI